MKECRHLVTKLIYCKIPRVDVRRWNGAKPKKFKEQLPLVNYKICPKSIQSKNEPFEETFNNESNWYCGIYLLIKKYLYIHWLLPIIIRNSPSQQQSLD